MVYQINNIVDVLRQQIVGKGVVVFQNAWRLSERGIEFSFKNKRQFGRLSFAVARTLRRIKNIAIYLAVVHNAHLRSHCFGCRKQGRTLYMVARLRF